MKSTSLILLFAITSVIVVFNEDKQDHNQLSNDKCGYYLYLPATFIYHDLAQMRFYDPLDSAYGHTLNMQLSLHKVDDRILNKYPCGVAMFELPFFLAAHGWCKIMGTYTADGFSKPYQVAAIFCNIFWVILGLFILRSLLRRYFTDTVTATTLLCITFGTNLYAYTAFDIGMSHPYSFFLFACVLWLTDSLYKRYTIAQFLLLAAILGIITIVRPINIIIAIIPLLWLIGRQSSTKALVTITHLLLALLVFTITISPQLAYWHYITGHWVHFSYHNEGFNFLHPHVLAGLFSYRKGWFVYTPMALMGITGIYYLWKANKKAGQITALFFCLFIYTIFSWRQWWYGGGFGCRPAIESLAVLALPVAATTKHFIGAVGKVKRTVYFTLISAIITLNIFQTYQYSMGLIHWSRMTKEYYWRVFGKVNFDRAKNEKYLIPENEEDDD